MSRTIEQEQARIDARKAVASENMRKALARLRIKAGLALEDAGLLSLPNDALVGAFDFLAQGASDSKTVELWTKKGVAIREQKETDAAKPKQVVHIEFPEQGRGPDPSQLRGAYQWNRIYKRWDGEANLGDAKQLARALGGTVYVDGADGLPMAAE